MTRTIFPAAFNYPKVSRAPTKELPRKISIALDALSLFLPFRRPSERSPRVSAGVGTGSGRYEKLRVVVTTTRVILARNYARRGVIPVRTSPSRTSANWTTTLRMSLNYRVRMYCAGYCAVREEPRPIVINGIAEAPTAFKA